MSHKPGHMTKDVPYELQELYPTSYKPPITGVLEAYEGPVNSLFAPPTTILPPNTDPIMQGFQNSEFYKNANNMQQDAVNFKYKGKDMMMNGSMSGALQKYLNSIGQGDLYQSNILGGELATVNPIVSDMGGNMPFPDMGIQPLPGPKLKQLPMPEIPDYTEKFSGYDTKIGGFDNQFKDIIGRLEKLEQGIGGISSTPTTPSSPLEGGVFSVYKGNNARGY